MIQIMAHRGSSGTHPENTLPAFSEAIRVGADGIELDVHLSSDQELIVMHDETVNRTTNGKGAIVDKTLAELKKLNAGSWFDEAFTATKIPTLKEVLNLLILREYRGFLNIEIKTDKYHYPEIERITSQTMTSQAWPFEYGYSSFNLETLAMVHELEPQTQLNYIVSTDNVSVITGLDTDFIQGIHPKLDWVLHQKSIHELGKPIRPWTVNRDEDFYASFQKQVSGVITDFPEKGLLLRKQFEKEQK